MTGKHRRMRVATVALLLALVTGCGGLPSLRWPWSDRAAPAPEMIEQLVVGTPHEAAPVTLPQLWARNTLVIDMQSAGSAGRAYLLPKPGDSWPTRIAFRVRPGGFGMLEVRGEQRVVLTVAPEGSEPVDLELVPGVYTAGTARLEVEWRAAAMPPPAAQSPGT
jgi:hypothetical protein